MPNNPSSINLAQNKQITPFDKYMNWTITIGHLIVILAEIITVIAFIYRFSLDAKLVNLHSAIKQKQNIVLGFKNDEIKYRNLQDRIAWAATFSEKGIKSNQTIKDILGLIPSQVKINDLTLNNNQVNIAADVESISSLSDLIDSLKKYNGIKSISIDNVENKPSIGLSVDITTIIK
jgi:hypothetical protein